MFLFLARPYLPIAAVVEAAAGAGCTGGRMRRKHHSFNSRMHSDGDRQLCSNIAT